MSALALSDRTSTPRPVAAPASGQEFALLPPDNATGNFTKVVQRIPVKIALDHTSIELRPGMSVIPTIATLEHRSDPPHQTVTPKIAYTVASQR